MSWRSATKAPADIYERQLPIFLFKSNFELTCEKTCNPCMMKLMDGRLQELICLVPRACHLNRCKDSKLAVMAFYDLSATSVGIKLE